MPLRPDDNDTPLKSLRDSLSPQQSTICEWVEHSHGSAVVVARAGTGKTYLLRAATERMYGRVFIGAYNKDIQVEIAEKIKTTPTDARVDVRTFHGAGMSALHRNGLKPNLNRGRFKLYRIVKEMSERRDSDGKRLDWVHRDYGAFIRKAVGLAKQHGFGVDDPRCPAMDDLDAWLALVRHHDLTTSFAKVTDLELGITLAVDVLSKSTEIAKESGDIDYDDMIYLPLALNLDVPKYDFVLIDEAQDVNVSRRVLAFRMLADDGRMIAVGDDHQAIYGFTGADAESLSNIQSEAKAESFPLTVTYRCGASIVAEAQRYVPDIEAVEGSREGFVRHADYSEMFETLNGSENEAVLCRNAAPLVSLCFALIRDNRPARIVGRSLGTGLRTILEDLGPRLPIGTLIAAISDTGDQLLKEALDKKEYGRAHHVEDTYSTLLVLAEAIQDVDPMSRCQDLIEWLAKMFDTKRKDAIELSTIHKSKGREWSRVWLLGMNELIPSKYARQPWQIEQESNLAYVGITRAEDELVYVELPQRKKRDEEGEV